MIVNLPLILQPFECEDLCRLGKDNDGGYLVNKADVLKSDYLLSFGIGEDYSFEEDFLALNNCPCIAYDASVEDKAGFFTGNKQLIKKNIGTEVSLEEALPPDAKNIFLKCDIDFGEYYILNDLIKHSSRFSGIAIEVHGVFEFPRFNQVTSFISKINQKLIHVHGNNYSCVKYGDNQFQIDVVELSFTSSENIALNPELRLPHRLDMPNDPKAPDFQFYF